MNFEDTKLETRHAKTSFDHMLTWDTIAVLLDTRKQGGSSRQRFDRKNGMRELI